MTDDECRMTSAGHTRVDSWFDSQASVRGLKGGPGDPRAVRAGNKSTQGRTTQARLLWQWASQPPLGGGDVLRGQLMAGRNGACGDVSPAGADIRLRLDGLASLVRDLRVPPARQAA